MCKLVLAVTARVDIEKTVYNLLQTNRCSIYLYQVSQQFSGVGNLAFDVRTFVKQVLAVEKAREKDQGYPTRT